MSWIGDSDEIFRKKIPCLVLSSFEIVILFYFTMENWNVLHFFPLVVRLIWEFFLARSVTLFVVCIFIYFFFVILIIRRKLNMYKIQPKGIRGNWAFKWIMRDGLQLHHSLFCELERGQGGINNYHLILSEEIHNHSKFLIQTSYLTVYFWSHSKILK